MSSLEPARRKTLTRGALLPVTGSGDCNGE